MVYDKIFFGIIVEELLMYMNGKIKVLLILFMPLLNEIVVIADHDVYTYTQKIRLIGDSTHEINLDKINQAASLQDLDEINELSEQFRSECLKIEDLREYAELMSRVCSKLRFSFRPKRTTEMLNFSNQSIKHIHHILGEKEIPAEVLSYYNKLEGSFLYSKYPTLGINYWMLKPNTLPDEFWEMRRRDVAESCIRSLGNLERCLDARRKEGNYPQIELPNVTLEDLSLDIYVSGIYLPDYIKDPALKQKYLNALKQKEIAQYWWIIQTELYEQIASRKSSDSKVLSHMYSQKPDNVDELKQILTDNKISPEATHRILAAVAEARGEPVPHRVLPKRPEPKLAPEVEPVADKF